MDTLILEAGIISAGRSMEKDLPSTRQCTVIGLADLEWGMCPLFPRFVDHGRIYQWRNCNDCSNAHFVVDDRVSSFRR